MNKTKRDAWRKWIIYWYQEQASPDDKYSVCKKSAVKEWLRPDALLLGPGGVVWTGTTVALLYLLYSKKNKRKGIIIKGKNQKREEKKPKKQASNFPTGTGFLASTQSLAEALVNMLKVTCFLAIPR